MWSISALMSKCFARRFRICLGSTRLSFVSETSGRSSEAILAASYFSVRPHIISVPSFDCATPEWHVSPRHTRDVRSAPINRISVTVSLLQCTSENSS